MSLESDREELERRLAQCRRLAAEAYDPLTKDRLQKLALDLEEQLRPTAIADGSLTVADFRAGRACRHPKWHHLHPDHRPHQ